ncbi:MAG: hypothetical protein WC370_03570 [Dehalococcoidales bacterium]
METTAQVIAFVGIIVFPAHLFSGIFHRAGDAKENPEILPKKESG